MSFGYLISCDWGQLRKQLTDGTLALTSPEGTSVLECATKDPTRYLYITGDTIVNASWCGSKTIQDTHVRFTPEPSWDEDGDQIRPPFIDPDDEDPDDEDYEFERDD
jgi:hypothetical protein